jgi:hypothetical protein
LCTFLKIEYFAIQSVKKIEIVILRAFVDDSGSDYADADRDF